MYVFEIEDDRIKFCKAEFREGKFWISKLGIFERPLREENIRELHKLLRAEEETVIAAIPRMKVSIHYHSFPSHQDEEIFQMARFQALRQFPYRDFLVIHSANILSKMNNGYSKVMLTVLGEEILNRYLNEIRPFVLPEVVTVNSLGVAGFYRAIGGLKDRIVVDIDNKFSNLCVIGEERLLFCREINKGLEFIRFQGARAWMEEVMHSIASFDKEKLSPEIKGITILGPRQIKFLEGERELIPFQEVDFLPQEEFISREENFEFFGEGKGETCSLVKILGLSWLKDYEINLTPPDLLEGISRRESLKQKKRALLYLGAAALGLLLLIGWEYRRKTIYLNKLKDFLQDVESDVDLLEREKKINRVFLSLDAESKFLELFGELAKALPQGVLLRRLEYEKGVELVLEGNSLNTDLIYEFYEGIKRIPLIKKIRSFKVNIGAGGEAIFYLKANLR